MAGEFAEALPQQYLVPIRQVVDCYMKILNETDLAGQCIQAGANGFTITPLYRSEDRAMQYTASPQAWADVWPQFHKTNAPDLGYC